MQINLCLCWGIQVSTLTPKLFKSSAAYELVEDFSSRIARFGTFKVTGVALEKFEKPTGTKLWICDLSDRASQLSSEGLANKFEKMMVTGETSWTILIGPHDGFSQRDFERLKPDFIWSFGSLTLPHELAAVVCSEQLYRAWSIIRNHPYHGGHFKK